MIQKLGFIKRSWKCYLTATVCIQFYVYPNFDLLVFQLDLQYHWSLRYQGAVFSTISKRLIKRLRRRFSHITQILSFHKQKILRPLTMAMQKHLLDFLIATPKGWKERDSLSNYNGYLTFKILLKTKCLNILIIR